MKLHKIVLFLLFGTLLYSCQKVISVKVKNAASKYVVEGNITDQPGPYTVKITKSVNYDQDNTFPGVSGAMVTIADMTAGIADTLSEISPGNYQTHVITGVSGHAYNLGIYMGSTQFAASSTMPQSIGIDTLYTQKSLFGDKLEAIPEYQDPAVVGNYYHLVLKVEDSISQQIYTHDDEIVNNNKVMFPLRSDIDILPGDVVTVELQCIDHDVFRYYDDLSQTIEQNSASPANPRSNIAGGALGYFSAHTVVRKTVIAQ